MRMQGKPKPHEEITGMEGIDLYFSEPQSDTALAEKLLEFSRLFVVPP
jgi:hypothetical protein